MKSVPIGDALCWAGLLEHDATRILNASGLTWGRRLSQLSQRDVTEVCFQVKARRPETWERWREGVKEAA